MELLVARARGGCARREEALWPRAQDQGIAGPGLAPEARPDGGGEFASVDGSSVTHDQHPPVDANGKPASNASKQGPSKQFQVSLADAEGLADGCLLSIKLGHTRRQASIDAFRPLAVHLPPGTDVLPVAITAFKVLATASLVLHPRRTRYKVGLGAERREMSMEWRVRGHGDHPRVHCSDVVMDAMKLNSLIAREYLERHGLPDYVYSLVAASMHDLAADPYDFMVQQLEALLCDDDVLAEPPPAPAAPCGRPGHAELSVTAAEGFPEGSVLSVRAGAHRRQAPMAELCAQPMEIPPGLPLKISVLVPVASKKLAIDLSKDRCSLQRIPLDGADGQSTTSVRLVIQDQADAKSRAWSPERPQPGAPRQYLERHGLIDFASGLVRALAERQPEDPCHFMREYLGKRR